MYNPLVSVVIPIYNVEKYLDRCVESVINQTYKNIEIILVDDGSTDSCPRKCDIWAENDPRVKVIHKENQGLGLARNSGLLKAQGEYIFFFDSDDYVDITIVEKCVDNALTYSSDAVIYGRNEVYEDSTVIKKDFSPKKTVFEGREVLEDLLSGLFNYEYGVGVSVWGKMFRLGVFKDNAITFKSEREIISEDSYFSLEFFSKARKVSFVSESLYYYFCRNTSLSRTFDKDRHIKNNEFLLKSLEYIKQNNLPDKTAVNLKIRFHFFTVSHLKQIMSSNLENFEKKQLLKSIINDDLLQSTLTKEVLRKENLKLRVLFKAIKSKLVLVCWVLLKCNHH